MGQVTLRGIHKRYGDVEVIKGVDFDVAKGEFLVLLGPSGCGKSTLLRMIAGLEDISAGDLLIDGVRVNDQHPADRGAAFVFQSYALYPHMTVKDNMGFGLKMAGVKRAERDRLVSQAAEILALGNLLGRYPRELSGGQRQRVAIGRAIVRKPKVFLFDEPLSNLDAALRVNMRIELSRLHKELGTTMIYVTHDQVEAMTMGDRIAIFNQGRIAQLDKPMRLYREPANEFVARFLGSPAMNIIDRPSAEASPDLQLLWSMVAGQAPSGCVRAGFRPEHIQLADGGSGVSGKVVLVEQLGESAILHIQVPGVRSLLNARIEANAIPNTSDSEVRIRVMPGNAHFFDAQGERAVRQAAG